VDLSAWWVVPAAALIVAVAAEAWLTRRTDKQTPRSAAAWAGLYVLLAVLFGVGLGISAGWSKAGQFYTGYLTEYSLSLDNLFVFYVIMRWFAVPPGRQHRVLLAGIVLAFVLRSALIVAGTAAVGQFDWLFYPLAGVLLWTAASLGRSRPAEQPQEPHGRLMRWLRQRAQSADDADAGRLITWRSGRPSPGPLLLLGAAIAAADLLFAFDSIPALLGITTSALLIVACNAFALTGLRQLYVLLVGVIDRMTYLNQGLCVICGFIGVKLLLQALHGDGVSWAPEIPTWLSLGVVAAVLLATVAAGAISSRRPGNTTSVLRRRFAVLDIDGNGVWQRADADELARRVCRAFGLAADSRRARRVAAGQQALFTALLAHMDANGDQQITREEFTRSVGRAVADQPGFDSAVSTAAAALLQAADQDGSGVLGPAEYARLAGVYGTSPAQAADAFQRLDLDGNGVLDTAELTRAIRQFFASPDTSAPGNLVFGRL
jgi:tellurite resistance protein TerC